MKKASTHLTIKFFLMFGVMISLIILNAIYSSYRWIQNTEQSVAKQLDTKLSIALSVLHQELEVFNDLSSLVMEQRIVLNDLMDNDDYRAINIRLQRITALYDADLIFLLPYDGALVSSDFFNKKILSSDYEGLLGDPQQSPIVEAVPPFILRQQFPTYVPKEAAVPYLCFKVTVILQHDSGDVSGHVILFQFLNVRRDLAHKIAELSGAQVFISDDQGRIILSSFDADEDLQVTRGEVHSSTTDYFSKGRPLLSTGDGVRLYVAIDSQPFLAQRNQLLLSSAFPFILTLAFSFLVFLFLKIKVFNKIIQLIEMLRKVTEGDLSVRIPLGSKRGWGRDEVHQMGVDFNIMMDRLVGLYHQLDTKDQLEMVNNQLIEEVQERRKVESALVAASQAKSIFLANMSHEIRTPMNAILGYAQILQRDDALSQAHRKAVDTIESSGTHLLNLINDILDISKIEAGKEELRAIDFDLGCLLHDLADMFQLRCKQRGLEWQLEYPEDSRSIRVCGDQGKLRQILINLLGNAVKFTDAGTILLSFHKQEGRYYFLVSDTGAGIPQTAQKRIFETFQQDEEGVVKGGTGLGLAISKKYIELMGGKLALQSCPGMGSRFFFSLPFEPASGEVEAAGGGRKVIGLVPGRHATVMVVDDNEVNRAVLCNLLEQVGIKTQVAESGPAALTLLQHGLPDLIFMDYRMPKMSGVETIKRIHQQWGKQIPIAMVSASVYSHDAKLFRKVGCSTLINKPFRVQEIFDCLVDILQLDFVYAGEKVEVVAAEEDHQEASAEVVALPKKLLRHLKENAELCQITQLETNFKELEKRGRAEARLAATMRTMSDDFDMDGVLEILEPLPESEEAS